MSIIDNLRRNKIDPEHPPGRKSIPPLVAADVEKKLREEEASHTALERQLEQLALAAIEDDAALSRYQQKKAEVASSHDRIALLVAAHKAALAQDEETIRRQKAQLHATKLQTIKRNAEAVKQHGAKAYGELLPAFINELKLALTAADKVLDTASMAGVPIADTGSCMSRGELLRMMRSELFRLTATQGHSDFPGASSPDVNYDWQPEAIPPATKQIEQAVSALLAAIEK